jgi:hypothetical protein
MAGTYLERTRPLDLAAYAWSPADMLLICECCGSVLPIDALARDDALFGVDRSPIVSRWLNGDEAAGAYRDAQLFTVP